MTLPLPLLIVAGGALAIASNLRSLSAPTWIANPPQASAPSTAVPEPVVPNAVAPQASVQLPDFISQTQPVLVAIAKPAVNKKEVMGRFIRCEIDGKFKIVWKYLFGSQPSEAHRIHEEFGVGEYHPFCHEYEDDEDDQVQPRYKYLPTRQGADGDLLILNCEELEELSSCLEALKAGGSQEARYIWMIEAIRDFMLKHPHQEKFTFESEF